MMYFHILIISISHSLQPCLNLKRVFTHAFRWSWGKFSSAKIGKTNLTPKFSHLISETVGIDHHLPKQLSNSEVARDSSSILKRILIELSFAMKHFKPKDLTI